MTRSLLPQPFLTPAPVEQSAGACQELSRGYRAGFWQAPHRHGSAGCAPVMHETKGDLLPQNERGIARWYETLEQVQSDVRAALAKVEEAERAISVAHSRISVFDEECLNAAYELETMRPWETSGRRRRSTAEAYALVGTT